MKTRLLPHCALVTPNIAEAERLSGLQIYTIADMKKPRGGLRLSGRPRC